MLQVIKVMYMSLNLKLKVTEETELTVRFLENSKLDCPKQKESKWQPPKEVLLLEKIRHSEFSTPVVLFT